MSGLAQPLPMSTDAWRAIRDEVLEPALQRAAPHELPPLAALAGAWRSAHEDGPRTTVFLDRPQAVTLAGLLDAHPELARLLGT